MVSETESKTTESNGSTPGSIPVCTRERKPEADIRSAGQEKKIVPFRADQNFVQPCMSQMPGVPRGVLGGSDQIQEPKGKNINQLQPRFCPNAVRVPGADLTASLRIFRDKWGARWICPHHNSCDHAVILHGQIVTCKKRDAEVRSQEAMIHE